MQSKDTFSTSDTNFFPDANLDSLFPSAITDLSDSLSHSTLFPSFTSKVSPFTCIPVLSSCKKGNFSFLIKNKRWSGSSCIYLLHIEIPSFLYSSFCPLVIQRASFSIFSLRKEIRLISVPSGVPDWTFMTFTCFIKLFFFFSKKKEKKKQYKNAWLRVVLTSKIRLVTKSTSAILVCLRSLLENKSYFKSWKLKLQMRVHSEHRRRQRIVWHLAFHGTLGNELFTHSALSQPVAMAMRLLCAGVQQIWACSVGVVWSVSGGKCHIAIGNRKKNRSISIKFRCWDLQPNEIEVLLWPFLISEWWASSTTSDILSKNQPFLFNILYKNTEMQLQHILPLQMCFLMNIKWFSKFRKQLPCNHL